MKNLLIIGLVAIVASCSKPKGALSLTETNGISKSEAAIIFDAAKKTDQNAAEVFDLGSVSSSPIKKVFNISNVTGANITLNFTDLKAKIAATTRFSSNIDNGSSCGTSLKTNKSCSFEVTLSKVSNESYDAIATNIIDASSRGSNPEFGGMVFSGVKSNDVSSEVPLAAIMRIDRLADSYQVPAGSSVTKRFYIGNIGSTLLKTPTVVAPQDGVIALNSCSSLVNIKPNGTCFFEITYTSNLAPEKANYNSAITFTSSDPLVNTTGLSINLAITNQPAIVPVVSANFNQVGSITDLSTANGKTRLYLNNTGSSALDTSTITIPSQYTVIGTSCPTSLKIGKTCFYDLSINTAQVANSSAVIAPITIGSTTFGIKAGDPAIVNSPNPVTTCNAGFSMVSGSCVQSNMSLACSSNGGSGLKHSTDGGLNYGSCILSSCSDNRTQVSMDQLSCQAISCTVGNSNLAHAETVSGDLVSGCLAISCQEGFIPANGACSAALVEKDYSITTNNGTVSIRDSKAVDYTYINYLKISGNTTTPGGGIEIRNQVALSEAICSSIGGTPTFGFMGPECSINKEGCLSAGYVFSDTNGTCGDIIYINNNSQYEYKTLISKCTHNGQDLYTSYLNDFSSSHGGDSISCNWASALPLLSAKTFKGLFQTYSFSKTRILQDKASLIGYKLIYNNYGLPGTVTSQATFVVKNPITQLKCTQVGGMYDEFMDYCNLDNVSSETCLNEGFVWYTVGNLGDGEITSESSSCRNNGTIGNGHNNSIDSIYNNSLNDLLNMCTISTSYPFVDNENKDCVF